jgi:hypothetical protein
VSVCLQSTNSWQPFFAAQSKMHLTVDTEPLQVAFKRAERPLHVLTVTSAPEDSRSSHVSEKPFDAAACNGHRPRTDKFASAPASSRSLTAFVLPKEQAEYRAVVLPRYSLSRFALPTVLSSSTRSLLSLSSHNVRCVTRLKMSSSLSLGIQPFH